MSDVNVFCPKCKDSFDIYDPWDVSVVICQMCNTRYELEYDETCTEDYSECWDGWNLISISEEEASDDR